MDADEFRAFGKEAVDFVADYLENIRERCVFSYGLVINNQIREKSFMS